MISEIFSLTFEGYQLVTKWNADMNEEKQRKILRVLALAPGISSLNFSCSHTVDISSRNSFSRKTSHNLLDLRGSKDLITREINRRLLQGLSELWVSEMHAHPLGESLSSSDFTDRKYEDGDFGISLPEIENSSHRRIKLSVKFNMDIQVLEIPYVDMTSEWMPLANERFLF